MVSLKLVTTETTDRPRYVARRECISTRRMEILAAQPPLTRWRTQISVSRRYLDAAEKSFVDLKGSIAAGTAKQELLLGAAEIVNRCCDELRDDYREMLSTHLSPREEYIGFANADKGEVTQIAELKEVLINARARKALIDFCGKDLTTAAERITAGADLAWAEREWEYTSEGWVAFKKKLAEQLNKLI